MSVASSLERQMLALINQERTSRGLDPLQLERRLNASAEDHSTWMLQTDTFSHTGSGGSSMSERMRDAGFNFSGSSLAAENIAWGSLRGAPGLEDDVEFLHNSLMNSSGHRANILRPDVDYIGIGIEIGEYRGYNAMMVTQNFARTGASVELDTGGASASDPVPTASAAPVDTTGLEPDYVKPKKGGDEGDNYLILKKGAAGKLDGKGGDDQLIGGKGNDKLLGRTGNDVLDGKEGDDKLNGHSGNDNIYGSGGNDKLSGNTGNDYLSGGKGGDRLKGGSGNDRLEGGGGKDKLDGGSGFNILTGGGGADEFVFKSGQNQITDFSDSDLLSLKKADGISSYKDLMKNHVSSVAGDVLIQDDSGNTVTLLNTSLSDLDKGDFVF